MAGTLGIFEICLLFAEFHMTAGMTVNIPDKVYKIARGDNAVIPCIFTPSATISSITWTAASDVKDDPEINVAAYFTTTNKITVYKRYKGRANIVDVDMVKGKASLKLQSVTSADTRDYECKVQDPDDEEGTLSDKASLVVLVAPSKPICNVVGKTEYFQNIELTCRSEEGTPTPTYKWQSYSVNNVPRPMPLKATDQNGALLLVNISMDTSGYYICTSANEIRSATCNVTLAVMPQVHMTSGMTVDIPDKVYKIARGDNVMIPCRFTPPAPGASVIISWAAAPDVQGDAEISIVTYFNPITITVKKKYKGRASLLHDVARGTANLQLQSVTSADTRVYQCRVEVVGDEEGSASDTAKLIVLGLNEHDTTIPQDKMLFCTR
ncbi:cell surface A33 antigen-like isoform X2 [Onychostoma macrolepis]|uniref:Ig-like domain-containing protein n=1 Tax=Onychostoma macrolepis TaxID=369639 RepID=A0A7J6DIU6_9TELE|nr:cell surface A33 antigen-like isoform X1 [Onychostoma macrolepis]XP_058627064.1 cell surface A33 antigen-like isoform X2 [Onychostoma macrolepis]KAF4119198.1 hypothetical protein G5714_001249 [Onychostoma macrolepis]